VATGWPQALSRAARARAAMVRRVRGIRDSPQNDVVHMNGGGAPLWLIGSWYTLPIRMHSFCHKY
jgi:hypothetical protein